MVRFIMEFQEVVNTGMEEMRLQKYLAQCGVASRRRAEEMILAGEVAVNGEVIRQLGTKVTEEDLVTVNGRNVKPEKRKLYLAMNKPKGVITGCSDDRERTTVLDLLQEEISERVYPAGRLDFDSSGLLLLTNDGELADVLMHPKHEVEKVYLAEVSRTPILRELEQLRRGVMVDGRRTSPAGVDWIRDRVLRITIHEGRNRQVRKMCEAVGLHVKELQRIAIGKIVLGNLPLGRWRYLTKAEITYLKGLKKG